MYIAQMKLPEVPRSPAFSNNEYSIVNYQLESFQGVFAISRIGWAGAVLSRSWHFFTWNPLEVPEKIRWASTQDGWGVHPHQLFIFICPKALDPFEGDISLFKKKLQEDIGGTLELAQGA